MNAELINIGNELLLGLVNNTHAAYLGRKMTELGFHLERQSSIGDSEEAIGDAVEQALGRADVVITTGGLGPTSDDLTVAAVAKKLKLPLRMDDQVKGRIESRFRRHGGKLPANVMIQARVPEGARVLMNEHGTAPGLLLEIHGHCLVILPGPPRELRPMFEEQVVPLLDKRFPKRPKLQIQVLRVADLGESVIAERVESQIRSTCPGVNIAYCARPGEVDLRLTGKRASAASKLARSILGDDVFAEGEVELEQVVIGLLFSRRKTVATAESCTGGALANRFTNIPGASEVFLAGWVVYANEAKAQELGIKTEVIAKYGAVSEQVAQAMAEGARKRSGADFALSVTGIAGPHGGTKSKPVGTVFIGLASDAETQIWKEYYPLDRWTFKWRVAQRALNLLRLRLIA